MFPKHIAVMKNVADLSNYQHCRGNIKPAVFDSKKNSEGMNIINKEFIALKERVMNK
jgi:hypothetical protein